MKKIIITIFLLSITNIAFSKDIPRFPNFVEYKNPQGDNFYYTLKERTPIVYAIEPFDSAYLIYSTKPTTKAEKAYKQSQKTLGCYFPKGTSRDPKEKWICSSHNGLVPMKRSPEVIIKAFDQYLKNKKKKNKKKK